MIKTRGTSIFLTRGDTLLLDVNLTDINGAPYIANPTDVIYFRLKKSANSKQVLIEKEVDIDEMILQLDAEDTADLNFGLYKYEIELVTESGYHFTAIDNADFELGVELEVHGE